MSESTDYIEAVHKAGGGWWQWRRCGANGGQGELSAKHYRTEYDAVNAGYEANADLDRNASRVTDGGAADSGSGVAGGTTTATGGPVGPGSGPGSNAAGVGPTS